MAPPSSLKLAFGGLAAAVAGAALTIAIIAPADAPTSGQTSAATEPAIVQTELPGLEPASGEPELASITTARPGSGEVLHAAGPFDQRIALRNLAFDGVIVSGEVLVTSDVSELLELQVLAGFYDQQGTLLGTERFVHHAAGSGHTHAGSSEPEIFAIAVPEAFAGKAVSAAVGVPVLVNE
ncbi:hypothetical protein [Arthrobacter sp. MDT1-65]